MLHTNTPFSSVIYKLRSEEVYTIFEEKFTTSKDEDEEVKALLEIEYDNEQLDSPFTAPPFNEDAALWAAKIVYFTGQLLLFKKDTEKKIPTLLVPPNFEINPSSILSADLTLRFIPQMKKIGIVLELLHPDDPILKRLDEILKPFIYSLVGHSNLENITDELLTDYHNDCYRQLFTDRIIANEDVVLARHPQIQKYIKASLGNYTSPLWPQFSHINITNNG